MALSAATAQAQDADTLVVEGTFTGSDKGSYREVPVPVPAGVTRMTVDLEGGNAKAGTYLVMGIMDPQRLRGWGGAIKPHVTLAETFATPSYLPGPLPEGTWRVSLSVASIRPDVRAPWRLTVHFDRGPAAQAIEPGTIRAGEGWFWGDLHTHTGQSDAKCRSAPGGKAVPCPVWFTLKAAADHGLDFVSVTDHNVASHLASLAEEAPWFDQLLVIPGREITTQYGHVNAIGLADFIDFRVGTPGNKDINALFDSVRPTGALLSINHPSIPTGEECLGCGWNAPGTDFAKVGAIEVANGGRAAERGGAFDDGAGSGTAWWEALLDKGFHLTGVGGSDNHDPIDGHAGTSPVGAQAPVGLPATVVHAAGLSQADILAGLRAGRVFVDLAGVDRRHGLDLAVENGRGGQVVMGQTLVRRRGAAIVGAVRVAGLDGARVDLVLSGGRHPVLAGQGLVRGDAALVPFAVPAGVDALWLRADVRDASGKRLLIGNPIYIASANSRKQ